MTRTRHHNDPNGSALFTDLYELTMAEAYLANNMDEIAVFELFFREMPTNRRYILAAGLEQVLDYLEGFHFTGDDLAYLAGQERFSSSFLEQLQGLRFTGDVDAVAEGTPVFADEPLIRVTAPISQAQLMETFILNQIHFQSVAASKSARVVLAADGRTVVDFGSRRAHGTDAALKVARASYLAGAAGTSNVLAGQVYDLPIFGTMAHSYIEAHDDEAAAFVDFARVHPNTTLLVDTYDTLTGVDTVIDLVRNHEEKVEVRAIRLDSGDLAELAHATRRKLDDAGLETIRIFASSGLDESEIAKLLDAEAPIDGFGVGTNMSVSEDAPGLDMAYKLVAYAGQPRMKLSSDKTTYPGAKQVYRQRDAEGLLTRDILARHDEELDGEPLLEPVMRSGRRVHSSVSLEASRDRCARELAGLPERLRRLDSASVGPPVVQASDRLESHRKELATTLSANRRRRG
jgi:nicotinate phosphoribosyltransferase